MTVFKRFEEDDIVRANSVEVTTGLWAGNTGSLSSFFSSSAQASASVSGEYYWNVYNLSPSNADATVQFAVAYGHRTGGGSPSLTTDDDAVIASKAIYSQYRQLLLNPGDSQFTFGTFNSDHIYVINVERSLLKQSMDPGNWLLNLSGSNGLFSFIDDSNQSLGNTEAASGLVYNVVSGSLTGVSGSTITSTSSSAAGGFGLFYPSVGIIVLNPDAISSTVGFVSGGIAASGSLPFTAVTGSDVTIPQRNHAGLYNSIKLGGDFQARSAEKISSTHYLVYVKSKDFNYTNNPSYFDETSGDLLYDQFITDPRTYITTVGLYNDSNELLAVGKVSQPLQKSKDKALLLRVRLDY